MKSICAITALTSALFLSVTRAAFAGETSKPIEGSWITFVSHRTGSNLLYRMRPEGSDCTSIFGGPIKDAPGVAAEMTLYREPHWTWQSSDGQWIVFSRPLPDCDIREPSQGPKARDRKTASACGRSNPTAPANDS